jgi:hypothetical protein
LSPVNATRVPSTSPNSPSAHHVWPFLQDVKSVSLQEVILFDAASALEIVRSPVFLFLCLVAVVPLAIQALDGIESVSAADRRSDGDDFAATVTPSRYNHLQSVGIAHVGPLGAGGPGWSIKSWSG